MDYDKLRAVLDAATPEQLQRVIVNAPFLDADFVSDIQLGIVVLLVVEQDMIKRVALSQTELAENTTTVTARPFHDITVPLDDPRNCIAAAIRTNQPQETTDWELLFTPALTADEAHLNQASAGIAYSAVQPLPHYGDGAALIFSYQQQPNAASTQHLEFMRTYAALVDDRARRI